MCFKKSDTFGLVVFSRSFLLLILVSIYAHRLLLLALILNSSSHVSHFKRDVNVMFLRGLIKAISLFKGVKRRVFNYKSYKKRLAAFSC